MLASLYAAKLGKCDLEFLQAYPDRDGRLACRVGDRVQMNGRAITFLRGEIFAHPKTGKLRVA